MTSYEILSKQASNLTSLIRIKYYSEHNVYVIALARARIPIANHYTTKAHNDSNFNRYFSSVNGKIDPFSCQCGQFSNVHNPNVVHMVLVGLKFRSCDAMLRGILNSYHHQPTRSCYNACRCRIYHCL